MKETLNQHWIKRGKGPFKNTLAQIIIISVPPPLCSLKFAFDPRIRIQDATNPLHLLSFFRSLQHDPCPSSLLLRTHFSNVSMVSIFCKLAHWALCPTCFHARRCLHAKNMTCPICNFSRFMALFCCFLSQPNLTIGLIFNYLNTRFRNCLLETTWCFISL